MVQSKFTNVSIVYYSGTGNTRKVARCFAECLNVKGISAQIYAVNENISLLEDDLLFVVYAVHAMNAPEAIYRWIHTIPAVKGRKAVVISVSGGGEVIPNTACRVSCIKKLERKGYTVTYETMLVMPSNWIIATHEPLAVKLLDVLPHKVEQVVDDILSGMRRRTKPLWIDRFFSWIGELEKLGARRFGTIINCSDACTGCGWCRNNCPAGNITMKDGRPAFGNRCHMCLNCLYGCPCQALSPGIAKFVRIKEGYSLGELEKKQPYPEPVDVEELTKGWIWAGVRKYLLNEAERTM